MSLRTTVYIVEMHVRADVWWPMLNHGFFNYRHQAVYRAKAIPPGCPLRLRVRKYVREEPDAVRPKRRRAKPR